jgi:hypothetical protein
MESVNLTCDYAAAGPIGPQLDCSFRLLGSDAPWPGTAKSDRTSEIVSTYYEPGVNLGVVYDGVRCLSTIDAPSRELMSALDSGPMADDPEIIERPREPDQDGPST